jgi:3-oxoacyl-[acyl-carrier protein] reductase
MKGRVVFVTGGTRGIGAAISRSFGEQGAIVAAGYGSATEHARDFQASLVADGVEASIHQGNIGSAEDCRRTVNDVLEQHGRLDILVNNAGITIDKMILKMTDEDWYKVIAVNLSGAFFMSQAALPHMIDRGSGRIITSRRSSVRPATSARRTTRHRSRDCSDSPRRWRARRRSPWPRRASSTTTGSA